VEMPHGDHLHGQTDAANQQQRPAPVESHGGAEQHQGRVLKRAQLVHAQRQAAGAAFTANFNHLVDRALQKNQRGQDDQGLGDGGAA